MRKAGATAREMLVAAAAEKWGVDKSECRAENGAILHARTSLRFTFGSLAGSAAKMPLPGDVPLKDFKQYRIIGKPRKRLDAHLKVGAT
jgi:isoquinoline 1-oxidoreductase beta subunit